MKTKRIIGSLLVLIVFFMIPSKWALAEERNIYIGDMIQIKVATQEFSPDELKEKFHDFEIVNFEEKEDGYLLTLRSFQPGEKKIQLGDKEVIIHIKSTLDEIKRDGIFEGDLDVERGSPSINWMYPLILLALMMLFSGGTLLWNYGKNRKKKPLTSYEQFMNEVQQLSSENKEYLVELTFHLKKYLEARYDTRIRGKTSGEMVNAIKSFSTLQPSVAAIQSWLEKSDEIKYRGISASKERKQEFYEELVELVRKIEETKEGEL